MRWSRLVAVGAVAMGLVSPAPASAAPIPSNCVSQFWTVGLRPATRTICDGGVGVDGSWMRTRVFSAPAYVADGYAICYTSVFCTLTPAKEVPVLDMRESYRVTVETVLPDEPGHLGTSLA